MKVAVTGSRDFKDRDFVFSELDAIAATYGISFLIHGDATGVDSFAAEWAAYRRVPSKAFPVTKEDWRTYGKSAGPRRNAAMVAEKPDYVIVFPGGAGTANMKRQTQEAGISVVFAVYPKQESRGE